MFSKQIRLLQNLISNLLIAPDYHSFPKSTSNEPLSTATIIQQFEKINEVCMVLQLDKPSDWIAHRYCVKETLSVEEVRSIMLQRIDFPPSVVENVCKSLNKQ